MAALERERIASRDRMTEVMQAGFASIDASNERLFQFQKDRLKRDDDYRNRRLSYVVKFSAVGFGFMAIVVGVILYMTFWGTPEQRQMATTLMGVAGAAAFGFVTGRLSKRC